MKKRSHKNRLHWNLANFRYVRFWHRPPPLHGMAKQCSGSLTDGRRTQEQCSVFVRSISIVAALPCHQGTAGTIGSGGWILPLAWNLRTASVFHRLLLQDFCCPRCDQQLPLAGHIPGLFSSSTVLRGSLPPVFPCGRAVIEATQRDTLYRHHLPYHNHSGVGFS